MANTLTNLIPTLYTALDVVSRELVGFIPAASVDATYSRAAVGQSVRSFATRAAAATDIAPAVTAPNDGDQTVDNVAVTITKARAVPIRWNGEEQLSLSSPGIGAIPILQNQFAQGFRTLCNEVEADLAAVAYQNASRAVGTAGTNPFLIGSDKLIDNVADVRRVLVDNGAPTNDMQLVVNTAAGAGLRKVPNLYQVDNAGDASLLRQGVLSSLMGFDIRESAGINATPAIGSITATTNNAGYAVGATDITLSSAAVALVKGDVITFANDTNQYVVAEAVSGTGGTLKLAAPGLRKAIAASTTAITVVATGPRNVAFSRSALYLATRAPAVPEGGDMADDATIVTDPRSGLSFEVRVYRQYRQVRYEVALAWGVANVKPAHTAILLG
jgi:hypothetical protein